MVRSIVFQLLAVFGIISLSYCAKEKSLWFTIENNAIYRNTAYVNSRTAALVCRAPEGEKSDTYKELAIRGSDGIICKGLSTTGGCTGSETPPSLSVVVNASGNFSCEFLKAPEPPIKHVNVTVYFTNNNIKVYDESGLERRDKVIRVDNDTSLRLICPESEGDTKVVWKRNGQIIKDHKTLYVWDDGSSNLTFNSKGVKTLDASKYAGWYMCERVKKDTNAVTSQAFVKINGPPHASPVLKSYSKMEGDSVTMSCHIDGEPVPAVTWERKEGKSISSPDVEKRVTFGVFEGIPNASMTISNLVPDDYADYVCIAQSGNIKSEGVILLRVRSQLAALWPFLGIVAEVIILVAIIFIYEKRRAKKEQEETEDAADQKKSLTASNNENKEIRQRKA